MSASAPAELESLVPVLRYRDVAAAAEWLTTAFGFERKTLIPSPTGGAIYAELIHGRGTIMLVPVGQSDLDAHMRQPDELGGIETQTCYVTVGDAELHLKQSVERGAEIVLPLTGESGGQRGYSCRDLEGHIWNFGTYVPAAGETPPPARQVIEASAGTSLPARKRRVLAPLLMTCALVGLAGWSLTLTDFPVAVATRTALDNAMSARSDTAEDLRKARSELTAEKRLAQDAILKLRQELAEARTAAKSAQDAANAASRDLAAEHARRAALEQGSGTVEAATSKLNGELETTKASIASLEAELLKERSARGEALRSVEATKAALKQEIEKREHLEQLVTELDRKAEERLTDTPTQPAASSSAAPAETGSVASKLPKPAKADQAKPASIKREKQAAPAKAKAVRSKPSQSDDEKPWPYNAW